MDDELDEQKRIAAALETVVVAGPRIGLATTFRSGRRYVRAGSMRGIEDGGGGDAGDIGSCVG